MAKSKDVKPEPQKAPSNIPVFFVIGIVLVGAAAWWYSTGYKGPKLGSPKVTITPPPTDDTATIPTPSPTIAPIIKEKQTYSVSQNTDGPKMSQIVLDPQEPSIGQKQRITATIKHTAPITEVLLTLTTDAGDQKIPLTLSSGSNQDGVWSTEWTRNESIDYHYQFVIDTKSSDGKTSRGGVILRTRP